MMNDECGVRNAEYGIRKSEIHHAALFPCEASGMRAGTSGSTYSSFIIRHSSFIIPHSSFPPVGAYL